MTFRRHCCLYLAIAICYIVGLSSWWTKTPEEQAPPTNIHPRLGLPGNRCLEMFTIHPSDVSDEYYGFGSVDLDVSNANDTYLYRTSMNHLQEALVSLYKAMLGGTVETELYERISESLPSLIASRIHRKERKRNTSHLGIGREGSKKTFGDSKTITSSGYPQAYSQEESSALGNYRDDLLASRNITNYRESYDSRTKGFILEHKYVRDIPENPFPLDGQSLPVYDPSDEVKFDIIPYSRLTLSNGRLPYIPCEEGKEFPRKFFEEKLRPAKVQFNVEAHSPENLKVSVTWASEGHKNDLSKEEKPNAQLMQWLKEGTDVPDVIVIAFGSWAYRDALINGFSSLSAEDLLITQWRNTRKVVKELAKRTTVLLVPQTRFRTYTVKMNTTHNGSAEEFRRRWGNVLYHSRFFDFSNDWIDKVMIHFAKGTGAIVWDSTFPMNLANVRECGLLKRAQQEDHPAFKDLLRCDDDHHPSPITMHDEIMLLLNLLCNRYIDTDKYCCSEIHS